MPWWCSCRSDNAVIASNQPPSSTTASSSHKKKKQPHGGTSTSTTGVKKLQGATAGSSLATDDGDFTSDRRAVAWLRSRSSIRLKEAELQQLHQLQQEQERESAAAKSRKPLKKQKRGARRESKPATNEKPEDEAVEVVENNNVNNSNNTSSINKTKGKKRKENVLNIDDKNKQQLPSTREAPSSSVSKQQRPERLLPDLLESKSLSLSLSPPSIGQDKEEQDSPSVFKMAEEDDGWPLITTATTTTNTTTSTVSPDGTEEDDDLNMEMILLTTSTSAASDDASRELSKRIVTSPSSSATLPKPLAPTTSTSPQQHHDDDDDNEKTTTRKVPTTPTRTKQPAMVGPHIMSTYDKGTTATTTTTTTSSTKTTPTRVAGKSFLSNPNNMWTANQENLRLLESLQSKLFDSNHKVASPSTSTNSSPSRADHSTGLTEENLIRRKQQQQQVKEDEDDDDDDSSVEEPPKKRQEPFSKTTTTTTRPKASSSSSSTSPASASSPQHAVDSPSKLFAATTSWLLCSPRKRSDPTEATRTSPNPPQTTEGSSSSYSSSSNSCSSNSPLAPPPTFSFKNFPLVLICQPKERGAFPLNDPCTTDSPNNSNNNNYPSSFILTPPLMEALRGFLPMSQSENHFWLKYSLKRGDGGSLEVLLQSIHASTYTLLCVETKDGRVFGSFTSTPWRQRPTWYGTGEAFLWQVPGSNDEAEPSSHSSNKNKKNKQSTTPSSTATTNHEIKVYPYTGHDDMIQYCSAKALAVGGGSWNSPSIVRPTFTTDASYWATPAYETTHSSSADNPYSEEPSGIGLLLDADLLGGETNSCATFCNPSLCSKSSSSPSNDPYTKNKHLVAANEFDVENVEVWTLTPCTTLEAAESLERRKLFIEEQAAAAAAAAASRTQ